MSTRDTAHMIIVDYLRQMKIDTGPHEINDVASDIISDFSMKGIALVSASDLSNSISRAIADGMDV